MIKSVHLTFILFFLFSFFSKDTLSQDELLNLSPIGLSQAQQTSIPQTDSRNKTATENAFSFARSANSFLFPAADLYWSLLKTFINKRAEGFILYPHHIAPIPVTMGMQFGRDLQANVRQFRTDVALSTLVNPGTFDPNILAIWTFYNYVEFGILSVDFLTHHDEYFKAIEDHKNKFLENFKDGNVSSVMSQVGSISASKRDPIHGGFALLEWATRGAAASQPALPLLHGAANTVLEWTYPITDGIGLVSLINDALYAPEKIDERINKTKIVPQSIEDSLSIFEGKVSFLSSIRAVTRIGSWIGTKIFEKMTIISADAVPAVANRILAAPVLDATWKGILGRGLKNFHNSMFTATLTMPIIDGLSRWAYNNFFEDETSLFLAQATVTGMGWYFGWSPALLGADIAFNLITNPKAYAKGLYNVAHGLLSSGYDISSGSLATSWDLTKQTTAVIFETSRSVVSGVYDYFSDCFSSNENEDL